MIELKQNPVNNEPPEVDLRDVMLIKGQLVRVGPEEWTDTRAQSKKRIEGIIKWILTNK